MISAGDAGEDHAEAINGAGGRSDKVVGGPKRPRRRLSGRPDQGLRRRCGALSELDGPADVERAAEQDFITTLYERLDRMRVETT